MTPYELMVYVEAISELRETEMKESLTLVWIGEYYHRLKRLPRLQEELKKVTSGNKEIMSDDEMLNMAKALNAQFGGTFANQGGE
jgi:hypothetical protein